MTLTTREIVLIIRFFDERKSRSIFIEEDSLKFHHDYAQVHVALSFRAVQSQPVFVRFVQRLMMCSTLYQRVRCKSVTSSSVHVATGHQIPCEWTYITLGCFLRTLTMTDRPRKDTDLSLFVGPYQAPVQQLYPLPPSYRSRSGHRILSWPPTKAAVVFGQH